VSPGNLEADVWLRGEVEWGCIRQAAHSLRVALQRSGLHELAAAIETHSEHGVRINAGKLDVAE
jgi:DNA-binding winged helix-turn-helix (wHTH) protein